MSTTSLVRFARTSGCCYGIYTTSRVTPVWATRVCLWSRPCLPGRAAAPTQPLTMSPWGGPVEISRRQLELSDIVSFHFYGDHAGLQNQIASYKKLQRPIINTEWMARLQGSRWETDLPLFKREAVGCYCWGLVNGRTQCQFAWYHRRGTPEPKVWFHDLFHCDGRPYNSGEHELDPQDHRQQDPGLEQGRLVGSRAALENAPNRGARARG